MGADYMPASPGLTITKKKPSYKKDHPKPQNYPDGSVFYEDPVPMPYSPMQALPFCCRCDTQDDLYRCSLCIETMCAAHLDGHNCVEVERTSTPPVPMIAICPLMALCGWDASQIQWLEEEEKKERS